MGESLAIQTVAEAKAAGPYPTLAEAGAKGGKSKGTEASDNITGFRGTSASYLARRLLRDHPAHFAQLEAGTHRSVRAAAIAAGIVSVSA